MFFVLPHNFKITFIFFIWCQVLLPGFKSQFYHVLAGWTQASYFASLYLSCLIWKMGIKMTIPASWDRGEDEMSSLG